MKQVKDKEHSALRLHGYVLKVHRDSLFNTMLFAEDVSYN